MSLTFSKSSQVVILGENPLRGEPFWKRVFPLNPRHRGLIRVGFFVRGTQGTVKGISSPPLQKGGIKTYPCKATGDPCFQKLLKVLGKWLGRNPFSKGFLPTATGKPNTPNWKEKSLQVYFFTL
jgi:hypothetical protein